MMTKEDYEETYSWYDSRKKEIDDAIRVLQEYKKLIEQFESMTKDCQKFSESHIKQQEKP